MSSYQKCRSELAVLVIALQDKYGISLSELEPLLVKCAEATGWLMKERERAKL